jgi:hypothetical protein
MASFVPEPIEKWAVWAESPTRAMFPWRQDPQRMIGNERQRERFLRRRCPASSFAKSFSQKAIVASSVAFSSPAFRHAASVVSTMNVECSLS